MRWKAKPRIEFQFQPFLRDWSWTFAPTQQQGAGLLAVVPPGQESLCLSLVPEGRLPIAHRFSGGLSNVPAKSREGRPRKLSPNIPRVVINRVLFQERQKLLLKIVLPVMLCLSVDVGNCAGLLGNTNGKRAVALLPGKSALARFIHPF